MHDANLAMLCPCEMRGITLRGVSLIELRCYSLRSGAGGPRRTSEPSVPDPTVDTHAEHEEVKMKKSVTLLLLGFVSACAPQPTAAPAPIVVASATLAPSPLPPTDTAVPEPTALPGSVVFPVDTLADDIPWLPVDKSAVPMVHYLAFNTGKPPFNSALVREAFARAIDRVAIAEMALRYKEAGAGPATTLTPPQTLGRDLYGEVGALFDPPRARDALTEAGYSDPSAFPATVLMVSSYGEKAPGARFNMANAMVEMWQTNLGIDVQVVAIKGLQEFNQRVSDEHPALFWQGWVADYNDPDNFLREIFHYGSQYNRGNFLSEQFDALVDRAASLRDPAERQVLYIQAERILCETEVGLIPLFHGTFK